MTTRLVGPLLVLGSAVFTLFIWFSGSHNPYTPAGYVGYLTKGAVVGHSRFYGVQRGPSSPGRTWLLTVTNVSITPYTYTEEFKTTDAVLSRDNLNISFQLHTVWHIDDQSVPLFMEKYSTTVSDDTQQRDPDAIVKIAYGNFVREPLRTFARDEVQRRNGLEVKDALIAIGEAVQAQGIANAMQIIRGQLSALYIQHEAIESQKLMVNSPNHTVVYIPSGAMGVPLTGTMIADAPATRNPK